MIYLSLEHPNIARLFDVYEDEEQALSFVMGLSARKTSCQTSSGRAFSAVSTLPC